MRGGRTPGWTGTAGRWLARAALCWPLFQTALAAAPDATSAGQSPPAIVVDWNTTFVDNAGPSGTIEAFAIWDDGSGEALYAGGGSNSTSGAFTSAGGIAIQWIGRWNGTSWSALGTGLNGSVTDMVAFGDELVVSGIFTLAGGVPVDGFARWNGQRWAGFPSGIESVGALAVVDGKLVVDCGVLGQGPGAVIEPRIAVLNGNEWVLLGPAFGSIKSALIDYNGVLVTGGNFSTIGGAPVRKIAQWTGSAWQPIGEGLPNWVRELGVHGGDLIASGMFNLTPGGSFPARQVARWNGSTWSAVGILSEARALASFDGELVAGTSGAQGGVVRFDGNAWGPLGGGTDTLAYALLAHGGHLYAGGSFARAGAVAANRAAQWDGSQWTALGSGIDGAPLDFVEFEGDLIAVGRFRSAGGELRSRVARWNGQQWSSLGAGLPFDTHAVAVWNEQLVAAGEYAVAQWDGTKWVTIGTSDFGAIFDLIGFDGDLVAAGNFTGIAGVAVNHVARWNGSTWAPMGTTTLESVNTLQVHQQQLVIGGSLTSAVGGPDYNVARWDGQAWQPMGIGSNYWISELTVHAGMLVAGGSLDGTSPATSPVLQWNGQSWDPLPGPGHAVRSMTSYGGHLVASSSDFLATDQPVSSWDGSAWTQLGARFEMSPTALHVYRGQLIAGGNFHRVGDLVSPFIVAYGPAQTTLTEVTATTPSLSAPGQPVQISVRVTGVTAPATGHVTVTGSPGGACTDLTLVPVDTTTVQAQCTIQWNTPCPRTLVANYVGGTDGLTTWQSSASAPFTHRVLGGAACVVSELLADGFE